MPKYTVTDLGPVEHDGKPYAPGASIELKGPAAEKLLAAGVVADQASAKAAKAVADAQAALEAAQAALAAADSDEARQAAEAAVQKAAEDLAALQSA